MVKTMKKILATVLSLAVCLSILCVPAMASDSTAAHDFPYMLFDFEDGISFTDNARATIVEGGMGGSGHALKIVETEDVTDASYYIYNKWGSFWKSTFPAGSTVQVSFWVKTANPLKTLDFTIVNFSHSGVVGYPSGKGNPASTSWQKVTINMPINEELAWGGVTTLRFGNLGTSYNPVADGEGTTTRTYLIDDFEVKVLDPNTESDADQIANLDGYKMGFESGSGSMRLLINGTGYPRPTEAAVTNGGETLQVVANPSGNGKVLKIDLADTQSGNGSLALCNMTASSNNYPGSPVAVVPVGSTITYTFKYYFPQEMASDNNPGFCMYHGSGTGYTEKYINSNNVKTTANEWHTATLSWTNNTEADATLKHSSFRICYSDHVNSFKVATLAEGETKYGNRSIYFDDFKVDVTSPTDATAPASSDLIVIGNVAAGNTVRFIHTLTPASTSAAGVTDASIVRLVNIANDGTAAVINYCGVNQPMVITSIPADSKKLIFEVVPVSSDNKVGNVKEYAAVASTVSATTKGNTFPYTLFTFEDDISFATGSALSVVEGGIGGGKALQIAATSGAEWAIKDKLGHGIGITIPANHTLRVSFWVKLSEADTKATFALINYDRGGYLADGSALDASSTEWQKVVINLTPAEEKNYSGTATRLRTTNLDQTILIDNFEMMVVDPNVEKTANQSANLDGFRENFEGTAGAVHFTIAGKGRPNVTTTAKDNEAGVTFQIVSNPEGEGQAMKVDLIDTKCGDDVGLSLTNGNGTGAWAGNTKPSAIVPAGATLKYTFKYYWAQEMDSANNPAFGVLASNGANIFASGTEFATSANEWHTATITWTNATEAETTVTTNQLLFCAPNNPGRTWKTVDSEGYSYVNGKWTGAAGERTVYIDDFKVDVIPASGEITAAKSSNFEVLGNVATGNSVWFRHTFAPASTSAAGTTDDSIVVLVGYNAAGERVILAYAGINEGMVIPAIPSGITSLVAEVVAIGSDGVAGNVSEYEIEYTSTPDVPTPDEPEITETTLTYTDGLVRVTAVENINNAYIIFVSYDANGKMVDYDMAYVNLSAGETGDFAPYEEEFTTGAITKAMLWADLSGCVPLATAIQY